MGVVAAADKLMSLFREAGFLRQMRISCTQRGFDPANRDGQGGTPLAYSRSRTSLRWWGGLGNKYPMLFA